MNHHTLIENIIGFIDINNETELSGWLLASMFDKVFPVSQSKIRAIGTSNEAEYGIERIDVAVFYKNIDAVCCGFKIIKDEQFQKVRLQYDDDGIWIDIFSLADIEIVLPTVFRADAYYSPSIIVIDNFYANPMLVRNHALQLTFHDNDGYKGKRTSDKYESSCLKLIFQKIIKKPIRRWEEYECNCVFQSCTPPSPLVVHSDIQTHAAIIFLTPNAPHDCGTSFYKSKMTNDRNATNENGELIFAGGHYDFTKFEKIDTIGNVFNRLLIWDASLIHAASGYFGKDIEDSRLFQVFFFDV